MTIISNSDIETWQKCERMYYYSRILNVRPKHFPIALRRGSFGHDLMEHGFQVLLDGGSVDEVAEAAAVPLQKLMESGDPDAAEMMKVYRHVLTFINFTQSDKVNWRVIALEDRGMWDMGAKEGITKEEAHNRDLGLIFGFTPDLVIEFTSGLYKGQHAVLDFKFLGRYMTEVAVNMAQQIPKYMIYRNKMHPEAKIRRGAFIQLNTRAQPGDSGGKLYQIKWVEPTRARLERIEYENEIWMGRVAEGRTKAPEEFLRTVNKNVCEWCFFANDLCPAEFDGKPIDKILTREYMPNDYGY